MRQTRLVFLEGLPGSGKSTTARYVTDRLQQAQVAARLLQEVEADHPLNVGGAIHPAGDTTGDELFRRYTVDSWIAESMERWRAFVGNAAAMERVTILDSYPYQNAARVLLQMDASVDTVRGYAREVEATAAPLAPAILYLETRPSPETFAAVTSSRGEAWTAYAIEVITNCPYAHHRNMHGADGAMAMLGAYHDLVQQLLADSSLPKLRLDGCSANWQHCYSRIDNFLDL